MASSGVKPRGRQPRGSQGTAVPSSLRTAGGAKTRARPLITLQEAARRADLSFLAASAGMDVLVELGVARELTSRKRNRVFVYDRYLALLGEGTGPARMTSEPLR